MRLLAACLEALPVSRCTLSSLPLCPVLLTAILLSSRVQAAQQEAMEFIYNFGQLHSVERIAEDRILLDGRLLATNQGVIVRTGLSKDALLERYAPQVRRIAELARLEAESLFLLELTEEHDVIAFATDALDDSDILYAQPDLVDVSKPNSITPTHGLHVEQGLPEAIRDLITKGTGAGTRIALIDDGFDFGHEELHGLPLLLAYDADLHLMDAGPRTPLDSHGTGVAGLIFSRHDGRGVEGIAPEAGLIAIRQADGWTSHLVLAFSVAAMARADIINCSWTLAFLPQPVADLLETFALHGRSGRGGLIVVAAGNEGGPLTSHNILATLPSVLAVGAQDGIGLNALPAPFSNHGQELDLLAPTRLPSLTPGQGYHAFGGTSASAAVVSGTAALLLGEDPSLSQKGLIEALREYFPSPAGSAP